MGFKELKGMLDSLISTEPRVLDKIEKLDAEGRYNEHVDPVNFDYCEPVGADYKYLHQPIKTRIKNFMVYNFIVRSFEPRELKRMGFSVTGRENLKGIKSAVCTSNHVNKLDCSLIRKAMKGHKLYITAASFNNYKGLLGDIMRSSRMMPMSDERAGMANFVRTINQLLQKKNYVLFYPERSEWWCYKKPRPLQPGAFHFAAKNNVPIIPSFITFKENGRVDINGVKQYDMTVNILKPIYPKEGLTNKEQEAYLMEENYKAWKECYERVYGIPLKLNPVCENQSSAKVGANE
jgi:1-acyl-sn-glycerol-3-phosphate acyltransferase